MCLLVPKHLHAKPHVFWGVRVQKLSLQAGCISNQNIFTSTLTQDEWSFVGYQPRYITNLDNLVVEPPSWKILYSQYGTFPQVGEKIKKCLNPPTSRFPWNKRISLTTAIHHLRWGCYNLPRFLPHPKDHLCKINIKDFPIIPYVPWSKVVKIENGHPTLNKESL